MSKLKIIVLIYVMSLMSIQSAFAGRGCCSHHRGVAGCDTRVGRQICRDGTLSPSCTCEKIASTEENYSKEVETANILREMDKSSFRKNRTALDDSYLKDALKKPGAKKLADGIIYFETVPGSGATPASTDTVKVYTQGFYVTGAKWLPEAEKPAELIPDKLIPCMKAAIMQMKPGGECKVVCSSAFAFGDKGQMPVVYPGATVIFKLRLVSFQETPANNKP